LGYDIIYRLTDKIVIMSTSVVSAVLLMYRKGITEDLLISNVHWLSKEILARGHRIGGINKNSPTIAVRNAIGHLENITVKTKKNIFELQISADEDYNKLLMLSYYRNALTHVFLP
jgi:glycerol-3-phosphate O-acyltransferase